MKLAVICPIGDLRRFGYWRVARPCLESWQAIGDLFLIQSSRAALPDHWRVRAQYLRDDRTVMRLGEGWVERFDCCLVAANAQHGLELARQSGYECALTICVNWYVEAEARHFELLVRFNQAKTEVEKDVYLLGLSRSRNAGTGD